MNKNMIFAFILSLLALFVWFKFMGKYVTQTDVKPPEFKGLQSVSFDKNSQSVILKWNKAKDDSSVSYLVYFNTNSPIKKFENPVTTTEYTQIVVYNLPPGKKYYFAVRAMDYFQNIETNKKQLVIEIEKYIPEIKEKSFKIETEEAIYTLTTLGARIKSIVLKKFKSLTDEKPMELIITRTLQDKLYLPGDFKFIKTEDEMAQPETRIYNVLFVSNLSAGFIYKSKKYVITKIYNFNRTNYFIKVKIKIEGEIPEEKENVVFKWQPSIGKKEPMDKYEMINACYYDTKSFNEVKFEKGGFLSKKEKFYNQVLFYKSEKPWWAGLNSHYFLAAIIPVERHRVKGYAFFSDGIKYISGIISEIPVKRLKEKGEIEFNYKIYAGPKSRKYFEVIPEGKNLAKSIRYRKFIRWLATGFLYILNFFYQILHNYGLAIILFSILIKFLLHPLTHKQMETMARMQKVQPIIEKIREQYKNNPQRMNEELMKIYKKHRVNPLGGCFPILLQLPIFIAIWDMLRFSLELRGAKFLWIKSLALPDTVAHVGSFPVNPLPIIMGITMILQQMTTSVSSSQNKLLSFITPVIFLFLFWNFPSGLVLYWTMQNILGIIHQIILNKKFESMQLEGGRKNG